MKKVRYAVGAVGAAAAAPVVGMMMPGVAGAAATHPAVAIQPAVPAAACTTTAGRRATSSLWVHLWYYHYRFDTNQTCVGHINLGINLPISDGVWLQRPAARYCNAKWSTANNFKACNATFHRPFYIEGWTWSFRGYFHSRRLNSA